MILNKLLKPIKKLLTLSLLTQMRIFVWHTLREIIRKTSDRLLTLWTRQ